MKEYSLQHAVMPLCVPQRLCGFRKQIEQTNKVSGTSQGGVAVVSYCRNKALCMALLRFVRHQGNPEVTLGLWRLILDCQNYCQNSQASFYFMTD